MPLRRLSKRERGRERETVSWMETGGERERDLEKVKGQEREGERRMRERG